jgi:hypothetical protein
LSLVFFLAGIIPARADEPGFRCVVDRLQGLFTTGGYVVVNGWAADTSEDAPVKKIDAVLDGTRPGETTWGDWRSDVMSHFARPDFAWSGWSATLSLEDVPSGTHSVEIFATSHAGKTVSCGRKKIEVRAIASPPERPAWRIGAEILLRSVLFLLWLGLLGALPARLTAVRPVPLAAPLFGLCLFAVAGQTGAALHVRPLWSAAFLTLLVAMASLVALLPRFHRARRPGSPTGRFTLATLGAAGVFALVGVVPLAAHGEGAVLGDIDDGVRECAAADALARFGWETPTQHRGYLSVIRGQMERTNGRRGATHMLAALAELFGDRAHAVHSVAMIASGCLVVLGTGLLAFSLRRRLRGLRTVPAILVALNSVVVATLYGQHLGNLVAAALFVLFLASILNLMRSRLPVAAFPLALTVAASWSLYAEALPVWAAAATLSLLLPRSLPSRGRLVSRYAAALLVAAVLNPVGLALLVRAWTSLAGEPTLATSYSRMVVGDTHYFPPLTVIGGLEAYRQDAPAPLGSIRRILVPVAIALVLLVSVLGWRRLSPRDKKVVLILLGPIALALLANRHLDFPYGFAKILPLAVPVWAVAFVRLVAGAAGLPGERGGVRRALSRGTVLLVVVLSLPSLRHVVNHARARVPSYDPAFRSLPALADVAGLDAVFRIEDYPGSRKLWALYFLGDNAVDLTPSATGFPGARYFRVHDRRSSGVEAEGAVVSTRYFSLVPLAGSAQP